MKIALKRPLFTWRAYVIVAAVAAISALIAGTAHAQGIAGVGGGGAGGLIQPIIAWFVGNIVGGIIEIGILVVGAMMIAGRHTFAGILTMVIGTIIITQYANLAGLIPIG